MAHSDAFRKMWWTTFRGAIECGNMVITELTINKTIPYSVKLVASRCFFFASNIRFLNTPLYLQTLKKHGLQFKLYFCITMYTVLIADGLNCINSLTSFVL